MLHSQRNQNRNVKVKLSILHLVFIGLFIFPPASEVSACPGNQIFLYNLTMCQQTCRSLADGEKHCLQDFAPVDGCGCPYNTYLDNRDTCVPISKCPCYYKGSYMEPGEYVTKDGERWYVLLWLLACGDKSPFKICFQGVSCLAFFCALMNIYHAFHNIFMLSKASSCCNVIY